MVRRENITSLDDARYARIKHQRVEQGSLLDKMLLNGQLKIASTVDIPGLVVRVVRDGKDATRLPFHATANHRGQSERALRVGAQTIEVCPNRIQGSQVRRRE